MCTNTHHVASVSKVEPMKTLWDPHSLYNGSPTVHCIHKKAQLFKNWLQVFQSLKFPLTFIEGSLETFSL